MSPVRMALNNSQVTIERNEDTGLTRLSTESVITTLAIPYERVREFKE